MKILKFRDYLVPLVLSGEKTSTWRLFDDKDLTVGDQIELREFGKSDSFALATIIKIVEKAFKDLTDEDMAGHETFSDDKEMYEKYEMYYKKKVGPETIVKIIWFDNLKVI